MLASAARLWCTHAQPVIEGLLPVIVAALALALAAAGLNRIAAGTPFVRTSAFLVPVALLGVISGLIAGASQEEVTGALLSGMLAIVAALLSYVFTRESLKDQRPFAPAAIAVLCLGVSIGLGLGGIKRAEWDRYKREYATWEAQYKQVDVPLMLLKDRYDLCLKKLPKPVRRECNALLTR